ARRESRAMRCSSQALQHTRGWDALIVEAAVTSPRIIAPAACRALILSFEQAQGRCGKRGGAAVGLLSGDLAQGKLVSAASFTQFFGVGPFVLDGKGVAGPRKSSGGIPKLGRASRGRAPSI